MLDITVPAELEGTQTTVANWLKQPGDAVRKDEPLVELETDKAMQEVAAPGDGILREIVLARDAHAAPGDVLGRMEAAAAGPDPALGTVAAIGDSANINASAPTPLASAKRLSPSVRQAVRQYGVDITHLHGSGRSGRITRADVDRYAAQCQSTPVAASDASANHPLGTTPAGAQSIIAAAPRETNSRAGFAPSPLGERAGERGRTSQARHPVSSSLPAGKEDNSRSDADAIRSIPHTTMRRRIAEHMLQSLATAPHVTSVFSCDFSAVMAHRQRHRAAFAARGVKLTYTAYLALAAAQAMQAVPQVNSRWYDDRIDVYGDVNIGIGTALGDAGLLVPVIRKVQELSLLGVAARLADLTGRARAGTLAAADLRGGTFTISNHGVSGSLLAAPIVIVQPQSAILGVGKVIKQVVVREVDGVDTIQIRPMAYVTLTLDHRVLDAYQANAWLARFVDVIEHWPIDAPGD